MTRWRSIALAAWLATLAGTARAEPLTDDELAKVFEDGLARFDSGDPRGAIELWAPLVEREPDRAWRALYNLGLAYEAAGNAAAAVDAYDRFVRRVGQLPGSVPDQVEERRQDAVDRSARLKTTLGTLRVVSDARIEGVVVSIDDGPRETLPVEVFLGPGPHAVVAIAGAERHRYEATVERGASAEVVVHEADLAPPKVAPPPTPLPRPNPPPVVEPKPAFPTAWVAAGAGLTIASFALPIGLGVDAWSRGNAAGALGPGHTAYADAVEEYVSARTRYYASYAVPAVLGAATLTVAIVGAARIALAPSGAPRVGVALVPLVGTRGALTGELVSLTLEP